MAINNYKHNLNEPLVVKDLQITGNTLINNITATGTASQPLQVTGGAYVSGSVGIGTTNPAAKTHIAVNVGITTALILEQISGNAVGADLKVTYPGQTTATSRIVFDFFGNEFSAASHGMNYVSGRFSNSNHWFRNASNATQMVMNNAGNLLIGTETDSGTASQLLQVTGGAYVSGNIGIGTTRPTSPLHVVGTALITGITTVGLGSTSTPPSNSQLSFELTSDTNLRFKVRGSDGVLRSANITLI